MSKITRFEEIRAWKTARELMNFVYDKTENCNDFRFRNQIRDAAVSVMSNIAEGFDSYSNKQFIRYLVIARASAGEVRSQLYVALDRKYMVEREFRKAYSMSVHAASQIWKLMEYLRTH